MLHRAVCHIQKYVENIRLSPCVQTNHKKKHCLSCCVRDFCALEIPPPLPPLPIRTLHRTGDDGLYDHYVSLSNPFFLDSLCQMGYELPVCIENHASDGRDSFYRRSFWCFLNHFLAKTCEKLFQELDNAVVVSLPSCLIDIIKTYLRKEHNLQLQSQLISLQMGFWNDDGVIDIILEFLDLPKRNEEDVYM